MIYLDHAATSWPKPPAVEAAMVAALREAGNPGRGGHRLAMRAADLLYEARETVATLFAVSDPLRLCFTSGATAALNMAIKGMLRPGDHAVCSAMEHNAVWRPLQALAAHGVELSIAAADGDGMVTPQAIAACLRPHTRLIVLTHASNVNGALNDVAAVGRLARAHGIAFLVDAAQTAGMRPIDVEAMQIDMLAFPGHKGLLGPPGIGGLYVGPGIALRPLIDGGTGSASESPTMPDELPDRLESGTMNLPGIAGLKAGVAQVLARGTAGIAQNESALTARLLAGLAKIENVTVFGPPPTGARIGVVSFVIAERDVETMADAYARDFDIACRAGLQCAPLAHRAQGTLRSGTIRFSLGSDTSEADIDAALAATRILAR